MRILLIEDDRILGETLKDYLKIEAIETVWLYDERQLPKTIKKYEFDVIVIDLILKFTSGEEIIAALRKAGIETPILVTTAKKSIDDKETCFLRGADDYLTKPFEFKEFVLRLKALSRRKHIGNIINLGELIINLDAKTIHKGNNEIKLSKKAWEVFILLLKKRGEIVDTETILNYIWPDKDVGDEIVRAYIKELRKVLPSDSIITYPGRGYKLS
ncbi:MULTISPECIES: response regulator transcription factor [Thermodesulfovibrio]|uniref:Transcriptional regulator n=1 Tax=Thermodesulfovibrio yellowstonii TaxID=28262 RepID=A0A9W6GHP9_9BACT|nr:MULTISPECIES: response regulator transcription factor [Thermodesulfovibrio]MDI6865071.1 response regulator transcription factor [Thermodesulfovibrio yellowstonii]GLI54217.1 transcriptional regulator [Thermodesulfovibrio islandicus]